MALCGAVCLPIICIACKQHQCNGLEFHTLPVVHMFESAIRMGFADLERQSVRASFLLNPSVCDEASAEITPRLSKANSQLPNV